MKSTVYLVKVIENDIFAALSRLMYKLNLPEQTKKIGIKINLCDYRRRETGVTTDPLVLGPLLEILRKTFPKTHIFLFEHNATGTVADNLYKWLGIDKIASKYDVSFVNLENEDWKKVRIQGYRFKEIEVPTILQNCMIINHPKLKTHGRSRLTCGLKNMYACHRIKEKQKYHSFLDDAIVDINIPIKSHYVIVDGYLGLEGNRGPTQGFPKKVGVLIGGDDIVAVDSFCARFMGFNPRSIRYIVKAQKKGIGKMKYQLESEIDVEDFNKYKFEFSLPKYWLMETLRKVVK
jgi:uncharacterized protein (DUF362 family)